MIVAPEHPRYHGDMAARVFWGVVVCFGLWQVLTYRRDFYLIIDDWAFFGTRLDLLATSGVDDFLLRRHNEHLMGGMVLWDVGIAKLFGLRSYTPWVLSVQVANAFVAWIMWRYSIRIGLHRFAAALLCPFLMIWGPFDRVGYWAPEAIFWLTLALAMSQFALTALSEESRKRDVAGAAVGTLGVFVQSICVVVVPITVVVLAVKRRWISAMIATAPIVTYSVWLLTYARRDDAYRWEIGGSYAQVRDAHLIFDFTWQILSRTMWQSAFAPLAVILFVLIVLGVNELWRKGGDGRTIAIASLAASVFYISGFIWSRGYATIRIFRMEIPSRYASVIAMLLLPIAAVGLTRAMSLLPAMSRLGGKAKLVCGAGALVLLFALNAYQRLDNHTQDMEIASFTRRTIDAAINDPGLDDRTTTDFVFGESVFFDLNYGDLLRFRRLGWL